MYVYSLICAKTYPLRFLEANNQSYQFMVVLFGPETITTGLAVHGLFIATDDSLFAIKLACSL